jgi:hypothetical protein
VCVYVCMYVCMYVCVRMCTYIYIYIYVRVCVGGVITGSNSNGTLVNTRQFSTKPKITGVTVITMVK